MAGGGSNGKGGAGNASMGNALNSVLQAGNTGQPAATNRFGVNPMQNAAKGMQQAFNGYARVSNNIKQMQPNIINPALMQGTGYQAATAGAQGYKPTMANSFGYQAATAGAQGYKPTMMNSFGYEAAQAQANGYDAAQATAYGYDPSHTDAAGYKAAIQNDPQAIADLMGRYQNQYTDQVVDRTTANMDRDRQRMQEQNAASAAAAGAFGGSRHGLVEAQTNSDVNRQIGDMSAELRRLGFDTAAGLAGQDIANNMQVGSENAAALNNQRQFNAENQQQANMFNADADNTMGQFFAAAQNQNSMFNTDATNARNQYTADARNQAALANAGMKNDARMFTAGQKQDASATNAAARNSMKEMLAAARNQASLANAGMKNDARQFTAGQRQDVSMMNANSRNSMKDMLAQARNQASLANAGMKNDARQFTQGNAMQARLANMDSRNTARQYNANARTENQNNKIDSLLSMAQGLGGLAGQSFGMGNTIADRQAADGGQQQALLQAILGGSQGLFDNYVNQPERLLQLRLAAAGMSPLTGANTTTQTQQMPNTLLPNLLGAAGNMFQFAPIALSSGRFKHEVRPTGRKVKSVSGLIVDEVTFKYKPEIDPSQACYTGIVAESLPMNDPAVISNGGQAHAVDYSKLEVIQ